MKWLGLPNEVVGTVSTGIKSLSLEKKTLLCCILVLDATVSWLHVCYCCVDCYDLFGFHRTCSSHTVGQWLDYLCHLCLHDLGTMLSLPVLLISANRQSSHQVITSTTIKITNDTKIYPISFWSTRDISAEMVPNFFVMKRRLALICDSTAGHWSCYRYINCVFTGSCSEINFNTTDEP
jgi:hypothetical protein